jgi:hypothetical protein
MTPFVPFIQQPQLPIHIPVTIWNKVVLLPHVGSVVKDVARPSQ